MRSIRPLAAAPHRDAPRARLRQPEGRPPSRRSRPPNTPMALIALQARNVAPDQATAIGAGPAAARETLAKGDAQTALTTAGDLADRIKTLSEQSLDAAGQAAGTSGNRT